MRCARNFLMVVSCCFECPFMIIKEPKNKCGLTGREIEDKTKLELCCPLPDDGSRFSVGDYFDGDYE